MFTDDLSPLLSPHCDICKFWNTSKLERKEFRVNFWAHKILLKSLCQQHGNRFRPCLHVAFAFASTLTSTSTLTLCLWWHKYEHREWVWTHSLHVCMCHYWHNAKFNANARANVDVEAKCERTCVFPWQTDQLKLNWSPVLEITDVSKQS